MSVVANGNAGLDTCAHAAPNGEVAKKMHAWLCGFVLGFPVAYPSVPYYMLAFAVFFSVLVYFRKRMDSTILIAALLLMTIAIVSNLRGLQYYDIGLWRILFTTAFFIFFFFGQLVPASDRVISGFTAATTTMSVAVIVAAFILQPWSAGLLMFSVPQFRLWGSDYFPDWPNFLAFMLSVGFLLNAMVYRRAGFAALNIVAALLTTSRTPMIAVAIYLIAEFLRPGGSGMKRFLMASLGILLLVAIAVVAQYLPVELIDRLTLVADREDVYGYAFELFEQSPLIGNGSVLLDSSVGHQGQASFHNSYLDLLVRHGVLGLAVFFVLIFPRRTLDPRFSGSYWAIVAFFFIGALFQNFFRHPHLLMIYASLIATRGMFVRIPTHEH